MLLGGNVTLKGASMFARKRDAATIVARKSKDQRKSTRRSINTRGWIRVDGGFAVRPCGVLDLSETGARLSFEGDIPSSFALLLSRDSKGRNARIKWRRGSQVGIVFV
jgi:hypothetical protein